MAEFPLPPSGSTITAATASVGSAESTSSTTFTNLATSGPAVTVTVGPSGILLVGLDVRIDDNTIAGWAAMGFELSGGNTSAANDGDAIEVLANRASSPLHFGATYMRTGLSAASTTITAKYRVRDGATVGTFDERRLWVMTW